jgi:RibD domain-containing protein
VRYGISYSAECGWPNQLIWSRTFDPDAVRKLKAEAYHDLTVDGPNFAAQAIAAGLVDEYHLIITTSVVGGGKRFFPDGVRPVSATGPSVSQGDGGSDKQKSGSRGYVVSQVLSVLQIGGTAAPDRPSAMTPRQPRWPAGRPRRPGVAHGYCSRHLAAEACLATLGEQQLIQRLQTHLGRIDSAGTFPRPWGAIWPVTQSDSCPDPE